MERNRQFSSIAGLVVLCAGSALAAGGLSVAPPWEAPPLQQLTVEDGALLGDGHVMPLLYEFTWSAPHDARFFHYFSQFLGTAHWESFGLNLDGGFNKGMLDRIYGDAARERIYVTLCPSVQHCAYSDETSYARDAAGNRTRHSTRSFLHPGYRAALAAKLTELAEYVRDKPYHMGWYPQDEYAYRAFSGYEECSLKVFREKMLIKYASLDALNQAWGTEFKTDDEIDPPREFERSVAFADWQEFRRWAQIDFTRFVYNTLKQVDPDGVVIWSLPFWGGWNNAASWWDIAPYSDVLMRHGIGYATGVYRLAMLRDVGTWSGKPANALCMPPDYNPGHVQMGFMFEGPPTGLSHVCPGGSADHTYYQGAADSEDGYKRKEPIYTASRSLNDLVRNLGDTYLRSKRSGVRVGVFVSDRTVLLAGTNLNALNGILLLLSDLNIEYEVFSEHSLGDLTRFDAIFAGQYSQCCLPDNVPQFAAFAEQGGLLVLSDGAFSADWYNRPLGANPGLELAELVGSREAERKRLTDPLTVVDDRAGFPEILPVLGELSVRAIDGATVIAATEDGAPIVTQAGNVVFFGVDLGMVYQKGYTDDFAGIAGVEDKQVLDEFAGFDFEPTRAEIQSEKLQAHKAYARLIGALLREKGVDAGVQVDGPGKAIGALRARARVHGDDTLVALANRVVMPGKDHRSAPTRDYHRVHENLSVSVRTATNPSFAVQLPLATWRGTGVAAMPRLLDLTEDSARPSFALPELVDMAAVLLTSDYAPLLGISLPDQNQPRLSEFDITVRVLNASSEAINGTVKLDLAGPLESLSEPQTVQAAPGEHVDVSLSGSVPRDTEPGYYLLQAVGEFGDGQARVSPSLEVYVPRDLELELPTFVTSLFPDLDEPTRLTVRGRSNIGRDIELSADLTLTPGFTAGAMRKALVLPGNGSEATVEFELSAGPDAPNLGECKLVVEGDVRGLPHRAEETYRLARGVVAYRQHKSVRMGAAESSRREMDLVCLENPHIKATLYPSNGVLHELFNHETGTDCLGKGDYPFGAVWYGGPSATFQRFEQTPEQVSAVFAGTWKGTPMQMRITLPRDSRFLRMDWDCGEAPPVDASYYIMSRLSLAGQDDVVKAALASGTVALGWKRARSQTVKLADLSVPVLGVENAETGEVFVVKLDNVPFEDALLRTRSASHNYMILGPSDREPGEFGFWFGVVPGTWDDALQAAAELTP